MSGALQAVFQNQRSFIPPLPAAIGDAYGGGFFAGQISATANGVATHNLIVSDKSVGQSSKSFYISYPPPTGDSQDTLTGSANSAALVASYGTSAPAAYFCENLTTGGYSDWYLPAAMELEVLYWFLKPTTDPNTLSVWANPYAVSPEPINTTHTATVPAQTTSAAFQSGGAQAFNTSNYLSSTQANNGNPLQCWVLNFYTAAGQYESKTTTFVCRAIRKEPV